MPSSRKRPPRAARAPSPSPITPPRTSRADGAQTRRHILETAARLYADKGVAHTTSKEICARAGTNMAAVNYHFGGKDRLYEAVLVEAHGQIASLDDLVAISHMGDDPALKLEAVLGHLVELAAQPSSWGARVLVRELMAPSAAVPALVRQAVLPKARIVLGLIGEILQLPPSHPSVQRGLAFVLLPCLALVLAPQPLRAQVLPALDADAGVLMDELMRYVLAGLKALRKDAR